MKVPHGLSEALNRRREQRTIRQLSTRPPHCADFSSNDFLSLASNLDLRRNYLNALQSEETPWALGSGGSRLLDGNSPAAEALERGLAAFYHAPAGLLCNAGFDANVGIFSCLPQPGDVVVFDELIHASVHDGMRQSRAGQCTAFAHNDVGALRRILERIKLDNAGIREGHSNVFVAIEAVYSMDGDVAPLADIVDALDRVLDRGNGHLILDEAHAVGVFGPNGRGLAVQLGLQDRISLRLHTFGKALACSGAVILCSPTIRQYLINYARPCIYSTFMPFPLLTAIRVSHDYLEDGHCSVLVQRLQQLGEILRTGLLEVANSISKPSSHLFRVPEVPSPSAISYVMSSRSLELAEHCRSRGFWVRAILPPTVPSGTDRVRICLHGGNTKEEVQGLIAAIRVWVKREPTAKI